MKEITIILPIHKFETDTDSVFLKDAVNSIIKNKETYEGVLKTLIIAPQTVVNKVKTYINDLTDYEFVVNDSDKLDFCSQINMAAKSVTTDFFSILEYDDVYTNKWFKMASEYYYTNEDVSLFLPINIFFEENSNVRQFCNELVWANEFSKELGYIDSDCLEQCLGFNLTGGIFNTQDFIKIGGFKPSIKVAFNYEYLLRVTNKKLKVFVVPKEGYCHLVNRKNSLTDEYSKNLTDKEIKAWFDIAKCEYSYTEDRKVQPSMENEKLK